MISSDTSHHSLINNLEVIMAAESGHSKRRHGDVDGSWAWVVLASSFVCHALFSAPFYGAGFLTVVFLEVFQCDIATTSLPGALLGSLGSLLAPVSSVAMQKVGWRATAFMGGLFSALGIGLSAFTNNIWQVSITYGVLNGFGIALFYTSSYVAVGHYFKKKRVMATGMAATGVGLGLAVYPPLVRLLLHMYGWRGTLLVMGAIQLHVCVAAALLRPLPEADDPKDGSPIPSHSLGKDLRYLMRNSIFYMLMVNIFFFGIGISSVYMHVASFAVARGATFGEASLITVIIGITTVIGRIGLPALITWTRLRTLDVLAVSVFLTGVATLTLPEYAGSFTGRIIFACIFGSTGLTFIIFYSQLISEYIGVTYLGLVYGLLVFSYGIGNVIGPPLMGALADYTRKYDYSFYVAGIALVLGAVTLVLIHVFTKRTPKSTETISVAVVT